MNTAGIETLANIAAARAETSRREVNREFLTKQTPFPFARPMASLNRGINGASSLDESNNSLVPNMMKSAFVQRRPSVLSAIMNCPQPPAVERRPEENEHALYHSILTNLQRERAATTTDRVFLETAVAYSGLQQVDSSRPSKAASRRRKPNFAEKLYMVLSNKDCTSLIMWLPSGRSFCITNKIEFSKKVLPKYLREAKFESFSRRLKRWGFRKVYTTEPNQVIFSHDIFYRDAPEMCKLMNGRDKLPEENEAIKPDLQDAGHAAIQRRMSDSVLRHHAHPLKQGFSRDASPRADFSAVHQHSRMPTVNEATQLDLQAVGHAAIQRRMSDSMLLHAHHPQQGFSREASPRVDFSTVHQQTQNHHNHQAVMPDMPMAMSQRQLMLLQHHHQHETTFHGNTRISRVDPGTRGGASHQIMLLNDDIRACDEQLLVLQKLKLLKERRRMLTASESNSSYSFAHHN